jgi:hypothetical protein
MRRLANLALAAILAVPLLPNAPSSIEAAKPRLRVGVSAVELTPFGSNPDWQGSITDSGVWGEKFTDQNGNRVWDAGEPFEDDPRNTASI